MSEKKNKICSVLLSMLCIVMLLSYAMPYSHSAEAGSSVTLICAQDSVKVSDMNWKIYKVGERRSGSFSLTGEYRKYPVDMSELSEDNVRGIAQAIESFIIGDRIKADAEGITDSSGAAVFNGLDKGLYLAVAKKVQKEHLTYLATPLLFEIKEDGSAEEAFPKIYSVITLQGEASSYTVRKIWADNDDSYMARPVNVTVDLFRDGELYDTVVLDEKSNWQYRWNTLDNGSEWRVVERNIPVKYAVLVDYSSKQFIIKNSYAPDIFIDGGEYTQTTTAPAVTSTIPTTTTSAAVSTTGPKLPQTGQLWWPVLPLALGGITLICIGILSRKKNKEDEK
ncbi:Cna B-type domain-containing protein [Ruminococcus sp.]|uniref:Cna B-type domain-containing protein n=1 Tax=Ruminococcus sp. TaxID=41978 RepID=UPI0025F3EB2F|nr:Cna B-type domain-containing protein [Ruminococcus sp.]MCR4639271.1 Cna B-type domain-containing protein [Ruminococcus sp.]